MALEYVGARPRGRVSPVLRVLVALSVEDLLLVSRLVWAEERAGPEEGREECARRMFGMSPERAARGSVLLAGLEDIAESFGHAGGG